MIFDYTFVVKISHQILHFISLQSLFGRVGRVTIRWVLPCFPGSWRRVGRVIDEVPTVSPGHIASQDATSNLASPLAGGRALHPLGRGEWAGSHAVINPPPCPGHLHDPFRKRSQHLSLKAAASSAVWLQPFL